MPDLASPQLRLVLARAYTQNPGEHALDGKWAAVYNLGQIGKGHHAIAMGGKVTAKPGHGCRLPVLAERSTPLARTVTGSQGSGRVRKKTYIGCPACVGLRSVCRMLAMPQSSTQPRARRYPFLAAELLRSRRQFRLPLET